MSSVYSSIRYCLISILSDQYEKNTKPLVVPVFVVIECDRLSPSIVLRLQLIKKVVIQPATLESRCCRKGHQSLDSDDIN